MACVFIFVIFCAIEGIIYGGPTLFTSVWAPDENKFGILTMIAGTAALSLSSLMLGFLLSLGSLCFILGFGPKSAASLLSSVLRMMTAVPTVIYGFASVFLLSPLIRDGFGGSGFSWLTAALVLSVLITPTIVLAMESAVRPVFEEALPVGASLGLTRAQTLVYAALTASRKGLCAAAILGFGRAAGDTMIPTMLAGNAVQYPSTAVAPLRTLTAHIGLTLSSDIGGTAYYSLFVAGGILLLFSAAGSLAVSRLGRRGEE